MPTRTVAAAAWTTLTFNPPQEPIYNFSGGNGILSTASGLGVLEHLAIVPAAGTGTYNVYLDNFGVLTPRTLAYSLGAGAPTNSAINSASGVFTWTATEAQGPGTYNIPVIVTDNSSPPRSATNTFTVVVVETNSAPVLAAIPDRTIYAGVTLTFTNSATDPDIPANVLNYSLDQGAPSAAHVAADTGVFLWPTTDEDANTARSLTVRATDSGVPPMNDARTFTVTVVARPALQGSFVLSGPVTLYWAAVAGTTYRVQYKNELGDADWASLVPDVTADSPTASVTDTAGASQRFYRILVVN
jgi:hypothetical protein